MSPVMRMPCAGAPLPAHRHRHTQGHSALSGSAPPAGTRAATSTDVQPRWVVVARLAWLRLFFPAPRTFLFPFVAFDAYCTANLCIGGPARGVGPGSTSRMRPIRSPQAEGVSGVSSGPILIGAGTAFAICSHQGRGAVCRYTGVSTAVSCMYSRSKGCNA